MFGSSDHLRLHVSTSTSENTLGKVLCKFSPSNEHQSSQQSEGSDATVTHSLAMEQSEPGGNRQAGQSGTHGMAELLWPIQSVKVHLRTSFPLSTKLAPSRKGWVNAVEGCVNDGPKARIYKSLYLRSLLAL